MLWFWGACGALIFSAGPLGVTLFSGKFGRAQYAALWAFGVQLFTGAVFAQVFSCGLGQALGQGIMVNGSHVGLKIGSAGVATFIGVGGNIWWPLMVRHIGRWIDRGDSGGGGIK